MRRPGVRTIALTLCAAATVAIAACSAGSGNQSVFRPVGPAAHTLSTLGWFVTILFSITTVIMWIILGRLMVRRRGTLAEHEMWNAPDPKGWIIFGGILIPIITLTVVFIYSSQAMSAFPMGHNGSDPPSIEVVGNQWWWEVDYLSKDVHNEVTSANEIHIPVGEPVDIDLETRDVIHSFWVPRLHGKVDLIPGQVNRIRIQADQPGVYRGQCAEYCGQQHAKMVLLVVAQPRGEYESWLARQRQEAAAPSTDVAREGQQLFLTHQCAMCHTVRGTEAMGNVGPDLTHLAGRKKIAASYDNDTANLGAWVTHAQSLKPGALMPNLTQFNGEQLRALVQYLQTLK